MTRQLRVRKSRPNYAVLAGAQGLDDNGAGPSDAMLRELEDGNSESEFEPDVAPQEQAQDEAEDMALDDAEPEVDEATDRVNARKRRTASTRESSFAAIESASTAPRQKGAQPKATPKRSVTLVPGSARSTTKQVNVLPNYNHRHRSTGIYDKGGKTERLTSPPILSEPGSTTLTNAWGASSVVSDRLGKSWGYNIGPGPLWELVEDRGWFKESWGTPQTVEKDRRPRVHERVAVEQYELLSTVDAKPYLPCNKSTAPSETTHASPPLACSFGPFGKQTRLELNLFDSVRISQFFPESMAHVFNAGAPVWGIDWCPIHVDDRAYFQNKQYLAVAPFPSRSHSPMIGSRVKRPSPACVQIWSLAPSAAPEDAMEVDEEGPSGTAQNVSGGGGEMRCEMVLCIDSGPVFDLKWCPLPANDPVAEAGNQPQRTAKLGIIGGTFEDGSLTFYAVPNPSAIEIPESHPPNTSLYVRLSKPLLRIELDETCCWSFDWANSEVVAIGCTNGNIAVYNIAKALHPDPDSSAQDLILPTHYFTVHQSAIRSIAWVRAPVSSALGEETSDDPTVIVSGGYDGVECITDIRNTCGNVVNRTRDVVTAMCFSTYSGSAITIDHENTIKAYALAPSMLGRGHTLLEPSGPVWSLAASDYHPQLAVGVTDGSCLTTNTMRSTRRGGLVPFFEHKVYQLDYSRALGEFRMLEHFLPKEVQNRPAAARQNKVVHDHAGAWPQEVGVHRVVWNDGNGLARTPLLASATASGLCRVDWLLGKWGKDPIPYSGVEGMRDETAEHYDEDEESD